ncbi:MAG: hypothetical protein H6741_24955 [Alphaproteobacteria bacterium]|nr:hypothetical protein [Alphaproteobacteria bacterium]MCB9795958.1 hypothetical protein [Alphaproteobacteria bacterium]
MDGEAQKRPSPPTRLHPAEKAVGEHLIETASQERLLAKLALLRAAAYFVDTRRYPLPGKGSAEFRFNEQLRTMDRRRLKTLAANAAKRLADRRWMAEQFGVLAKLDLSSELSVAKQAAKLAPDIRRRLPARAPTKRSRFEAPDPQAVNARAAQLPMLPLVPLVPVNGPNAELVVVNDPRQALLTDPVQRQSFVSAVAAISARYDALKGASVLLGDPTTGVPSHGDGWYSRRYDHGVIYHKRPDLTLALHRDSIGVAGISDKYLALDAHEGPLGFPLTEIKDVPYEEGRVALFEQGLLIHQKPHQTHEPHYIACWPIIGHWFSLGFAAGSLGFPLEDPHPRQTRGGGEGQWVQFNNGRIYHAEDTGTHILEWMLAVSWEQHAEALGFPTSPAKGFGQGPWRLQTFEGGAIAFRRDTFEQRVAWGPLWEIWWTHRGQAGFGGLPNPVEPLPGGHGWFMRCPNWVLMWDGGQRTAIVHHEGFDIWRSLVRGSGEDPGFPAGSEVQHQAAGCMALFCPGAVILRASGRTTRWISPAAFSKWVEWGGVEGRLGWPVEDFKRSVFPSALSGQKEPYAAAIFEDAIIYDRGDIGTFLLLGPWLAAHVRAYHGLPLSDVEERPELMGAAARFERVLIFQADEGGDEARVIRRELFEAWVELHPIRSGLGWPVDDDWPLHKDGGVVGRQLRCQHGTLYKADGHAARALTGMFDEAYRRLGQGDSFLGLPTGTPFTRDGGDTTVIACEQGALVTGAYLTHAVGVPSPVYGVWDNMGRGEGSLGRPTQDPLGDPRYALNYGQPFQGGMVSVNEGQASAHYTNSRILLRLERLDVWRQTSGESGGDDISLSTVAIWSNSNTTHHLADLGHFGGGSGRDLDRVLFRAPMISGQGWPKSYAALLSPVERDDGGLDGVAAALLDVAREAVEQAAKDAASAAIQTYLGAVPPLAWIADYLAAELIEEIVGEVFEWFAELFEDPDDVFDPKMVHFGIFRYDRLNGGGPGDAMSLRGPRFGVSFEQHGAHWTFFLRWELELGD